MFELLFGDRKVGAWESYPPLDEIKKIIDVDNVVSGSDIQFLFNGARQHQNERVLQQYVRTKEIQAVYADPNATDEQLVSLAFEIGAMNAECQAIIDSILDEIKLLKILNRSAELEKLSKDPTATVDQLLGAIPEALELARQYDEIVKRLDAKEGTSAPQKSNIKQEDLMKMFAGSLAGQVKH